MKLGIISNRKKSYSAKKESEKYANTSLKERGAD